ncbi:MAG: SDR family oxidoreductase [Gammaproteobacteria bacterium]|nr:SDR family oxidoreductase [Gammaproteobacteria bacterium]
MNQSTKTVERLIVAGGSSGMGLAVAQAALAKGVQVTIVGRSADKLHQATNKLGASAPVQTIAADITDETDVIRLFKTVGPFTHLITTAASVTYQPVKEFDVDAARKILDSKLIGPLLLAKHGAPLINAGGSITFTSGIAAYRPGVNASMVAAVNGGLAAFARALAVELAPIRVNVVSPGWVDTPIWTTIAGNKKRAMFEQMAKCLLVGRIGTPNDIAQAILFLTENQYTTGSVLHVDGGHRLV